MKKSDSSSSRRQTVLFQLLAGIFSLFVIALAIVICSSRAEQQVEPSASLNPTEGTELTDASEPHSEPDESTAPDETDNDAQEQTDSSENINSTTDAFLYNPDGTPDLPESSPNQQTFDIPGFTPIENATIGDLGRNFRLAAVGRYSGPFMEDGSDEEVENVLALIVENQSDDFAEFVQLQLDVNGQPAQFRISAFAGHSYCFVLEKDRMTAPEDSKLPLPEITSFAPLLSGVTDYSNDFDVYPANGTINLFNKSGRDFSSDVFLYFKTFSNGVYMGGITYRVTFSDGIANDTLAQALQSHFSKSSSVILYMNYEQES